LAMIRSMMIYPLLLEVAVSATRRGVVDQTKKIKTADEKQTSRVSTWVLVSRPPRRDG